MIVVSITASNSSYRPSSAIGLANLKSSNRLVDRALACEIGLLNTGILQDLTAKPDEFLLDPGRYELRYRIDYPNNIIVA